MKSLKWAAIAGVMLLPAIANAGFMTGAVVGAAAGHMSCGPCEKTLQCIKDHLRIKDHLPEAAWKGKEAQLVDACEAQNHHRSAAKPEPLAAPKQ